MKRTALDIIQRFRYQEALDAPASLVGSTDVNVLQLIHLLYATCEDLRQAQCWDQQKKRHSFATSSSTASYQLPKDYYAPIIGTHWNDDETIALLGPVNDADFDAKLYGNVPSSVNFTFRIFGPDENPSSAGGQFNINPTPSSAINLGFSYISRDLFTPQDWAASTTYTTADYVNANGNAYHCTTGGTSGATAPTGTGSSISDGTVVWAYYNTPYETLIADTDLVIFDADLVQLGLRAKWREHKRGEATAATEEFKSKIDAAKARTKGAFISSMCGREYYVRYEVPYKNWSV